MANSEVFERLGEILEEQGIQPRGVIHVGAHKGQEIEFYQPFERVVLVEPNPALFEDLQEACRKHRNATVIQIAVGNRHGYAHLHITQWDEQSSTLPPLTYPVVGRKTVCMKPLWELQGEDLNVAVIDTQGNEGQVLEYAALHKLDLVIVELSYYARYQHADRYADVVQYMTAEGWTLLHEYQHPGDETVVDAVFRRGS